MKKLWIIRDQTDEIIKFVFFLITYNLEKSENNVLSSFNFYTYINIATLI